MLGGADNSNGELPSYITGANNNELYADSRAFRSFWVLPVDAFGKHGQLSRSKVHLSVTGD